MANRAKVAWLYLILSGFVLGLILIISNNPRQFKWLYSSLSMSILDSPMGLMSMILILFLLVAAFFSTLLQMGRDKRIAKRKTSESIDKVGKTIRIYDIPSGTISFSPSRPSEISSRMSMLARRGETGIVEFLDYIMAAALKLRVSDVHIEPGMSEVALKYRIDGALQTMVTFPSQLLDRLVSRIRILANLSTYEKGKPQDGRINLCLKGRHYDVRLSTIPTLHGDKAVIRLFESHEHDFDLRNLGMLPEIYEVFSGMLVKPQGTVLLTGPTGSGKTTTMYSAVRFILEHVGSTTNIVTIEDPIEREIPGVNQTQVDLKHGLSFAAGLRSLLRQDPDVIMVGEIRDRETAEICIQAGLTGHLIISSIHAINSAGVFNRLIEMGIEPFLLASSVTGVLAQRLVRLNCNVCAKASVPSLKSLKSLNIPLNADIKFMKGEGCENCWYKGYSGRVGIFEILEVTPPIKQAIVQKVETSELISLARNQGLIPLRDAGLEFIRRGIVDVDELARVAG
ncbi:type II/IV secretion system protein [bacterium]|nr:type II/IV secretion system protein [candidate division CSSED10-310 bacterium]